MRIAARKEGTVRQVVVALCRDYGRRREEILRARVSRRTAMEYKYLNGMILEAAREEVGEALVPAFIAEIGEEVGYARSRVDCMAEGTYKAAKARVIRAIARKLHLCD